MTSSYLKYLNIFVIVLFVTFKSFCQSPQVEKQSLFNFTDPDSSLVIAQDASYEFISKEGANIIKVTNGYTHRETGVIIKSPVKNPWSLVGTYQVKADVANVGDEYIQVEMFVGNDPDGLVRWYCSDYVDLEPGESKTITVNLAWTSWAFKPQLNVVGMRGVPGKIKTDLSLIDEITFCSRYATQENEFIISSVYAQGKLEEQDTSGFFPFVDVYGQYKHKEWEGKVHSDEELKQMAEAEQIDLKSHPEAENRGKYGGWLAGPKLEATGFFHPQKHDGKWWIVDPEGYLFWSHGLNCVLPGNSTGVEHRENYFESLPVKNGDYSQFYGKSRWASHGYYKGKTPYDTYNHYGANMYKKYGKDWHKTFMDLAHQRIKSWGMNTIGFVSDREAINQQKTPYVGSVWIRNTPTIEGSQGFWGKFHDVFDPGFRKAVRSSMEAQKQGAGDLWCIGYFVDNEMSWGTIGSLSMGVLRSSAGQPAKKEFVSDLKKKYNSIDKLNDSWKTNYSSWKDLMKNTSPELEDTVNADLVEFYEKIALTYFRTVKEEMNRIAPNQNYLGCRFAWANNDITIKSAAKYCDILSFNKYEYSIENVGLPAGVDKPILIGEYHFGATDRGNVHPGVKVAIDQKDRGEKYKSYMLGAFRNPNIVGAHWFQYTDQPLTGRGDGENYNVGFLDVCDNPYKELIEKVRETTYTMYEYRYEFKE